MGKKVQGIRSINSRYKIDKGMLGIVWAMEKLKNLYDMYNPWTWTKGGGYAGGRWGAKQKGIKGRNIWDNCNGIIKKRYVKYSKWNYKIINIFFHSL